MQDTTFMLWWYIFFFNFVVAKDIEIIVQPLSQSVDLRQHSFFTCLATGSNMKYRWIIKLGSFPSKVIGINTNTLVIPDVRSSDDNTYTCVASNNGGSVTSDPAKLTVTGRAISYYMFTTWWWTLCAYRSARGDFRFTYSKCRGYTTFPVYYHSQWYREKKLQLSMET